MSLLNQVYRDGLVMVKADKVYWVSPHAIAGLITRSRLSGRQVIAGAFTKGWTVPTPPQAAYIANAITLGEAFLVRRGPWAIAGNRHAEVRGTGFVTLKAKIYMIPI